METDAIIQVALKEEFKDKTVLVIAHRIETILDMDRILVIADGKVSRFETPTELAKDKNFRTQVMAGYSVN